MVTRSTEIDLDTLQARKKASILALLEQLMDRVEHDRAFGEFSVTFTAQAGKIGHYEEVIRRTFK